MLRAHNTKTNQRNTDHSAQEQKWYIVKEVYMINHTMHLCLEW